jgi:hypothetical protein
MASLGWVVYKEHAMRTTILLLAAIALGSSPAWSAQDNNSTVAQVPDLASHYEEILGPLDSVLEDLENENLPLTNESGEPVGHRPIENRRKALEDLRQTLEKLRGEPASLKGAVTLLVQSESLSDELYDLAQVAYDNDREELGKRISEVVNSLDAEQEAVESLTLALADEKEDRIKKLEVENESLRQKLKKAVERP